MRVATAEDLPFIDALQKMHTHMVGWFPQKQMQQKIEAGHVLVAEEPSPQPSPGVPGEGVRLGYIIAHDQYSGRDDVGIIYQLNVAPLKQRHLIGATLVKNVFERAAYGCRLFSCWCAQDIQANFFWEACGFVPLAFRTGSASKQRIHIFWQRRVRADDVGERATPYWFPSLTRSGAVREDRIVLPIPPGTHWRDVMPIILPGMREKEQATLPEHGLKTRATKKPFVRKVEVAKPAPSKFLQETPPGKAAVVVGGKIKYLDRADYVPEPEPAKPKRPSKPRVKNDPKMIAAARELRDKYLEQINSTQFLPQGKYEVSRQVAMTPASTRRELPEAA